MEYIQGLQLTIDDYVWMCVIVATGCYLLKQVWTVFATKVIRIFF